MAIMGTRGNVNCTERIRVQPDRRRPVVRHKAGATRASLQPRMASSKLRRDASRNRPQHKRTEPMTEEIADPAMTDSPSELTSPTEKSTLPFTFTGNAKD